MLSIALYLRLQKACTSTATINCDARSISTARRKKLTDVRWSGKSPQWVLPLDQQHSCPDILLTNANSNAGQADGVPSLAVKQQAWIHILELKYAPDLEIHRKARDKARAQQVRHSLMQAGGRSPSILSLLRAPLLLQALPLSQSSACRILRVLIWPKNLPLVAYGAPQTSSVRVGAILQAVQLPGRPLTAARPQDTAWMRAVTAYVRPQSPLKQAATGANPLRLPTPQGRSTPYPVMMLMLQLQPHVLMRTHKTLPLHLLPVAMANGALS